MNKIIEDYKNHILLIFRIELRKNFIGITDKQINILLDDNEPLNNSLYSLLDDLIRLKKLRGTQFFTNELK